MNYGVIMPGKSGVGGDTEIVLEGREQGRLEWKARWLHVGPFMPRPSCVLVTVLLLQRDTTAKVTYRGKYLLEGLLTGSEGSLQSPRQGVWWHAGSDGAGERAESFTAWSTGRQREKNTGLVNLPPTGEQSLQTQEPVGPILIQTSTGG